MSENEMSDEERAEIDAQYIDVRMHDTGRMIRITNRQIGDVDEMGIPTEQLGDVTVVASVAMALDIDAVHADVLCTLVAEYRRLVAEQ